MIPLDGESFSKQELEAGDPSVSAEIGFRPLDGESFSKQVTEPGLIPDARFPSPRRGIIF